MGEKLSRCYLLFLVSSSTSSTFCIHLRVLYLSSSRSVNCLGNQSLSLSQSKHTPGALLPTTGHNMYPKAPQTVRFWPTKPRAYPSVTGPTKYTLLDHLPGPLDSIGIKDDRCADVHARIGL